MKLKYLGTAAAEGIPALFCNCAVCRHAIAVRGKEIKTRSQAVVDGRLLIDFPADTYMHMLYGGLDLKNIRHLIVTHSHSDHFYEKDFWCREPGIGNEIGEDPLHVYVTSPGKEQAMAFMQVHMKDTHRVLLHEIRAFAPFEAGSYLVTPLRADHDAKTDPVFYQIEREGKTLLYANDTGYFPDETWDYLDRHGKHIDFLSLDCTGMLLPNYRHGHMGLSVNAEVVARLTEMGLCDSGTAVCVNHFSHNGRATHEELREAAEEYGFLTSYDGFEVEF